MQFATNVTCSYDYYLICEYCFTTLPQIESEAIQNPTYFTK